MDTIFINPKNSKTSDLERLLVCLTGKIDLKKADKFISLSNLRKFYTRKNIKKSFKE